MSNYIFGMVFGSDILQKSSSGGSPVADFTLNSTLTVLSPLTSTVGTISSSDPSVTYTLTNDASGQFSMSGNMLRLEKAQGTVGTSYNISIQGYKSGSTLTKNFTVTVAAKPNIGLVARWASDTNVTDSGSGTVAAWVDTVNGYTLGNATTAARPTIVANGFGSKQTIRFNGSSQRLLSTDAIASLLNSGTQDVTILVACVPSSWSVQHVLTSWAFNSGANIRLDHRIDSTGRLNFVFGDGTGTSNQGLSGSASPLPVTNPTPGAARVMGAVVIPSRSYFYLAENAQVSATGSTAKNAAVTGSTFGVGARATTTGATYFPGDILEIRVYNRALYTSEVEYESREMATYWGISYASSTTIDLTQYDQTFVEDFDQYAAATDLFDTQATDKRVRNKPLLPAYTMAATRNQYGSPGALGAELGWMADPRDSNFSALGNYGVGNGILTLTSIPRPGSLSGLSLKNGNNVDCTYITGAVITHGFAKTGGFSQEYGYYEWRFQLPLNVVTGFFPAQWNLMADGRWPGEIDAMELFGTAWEYRVAPSTHNDPYWSPGGANTGTNANANINVGATVYDGTCPIDQEDVQFVTVGIDVYPDTGIRCYANRKLIGTIPPQRGIISVAITNGGTGVIADNATQNGTLAIQAAPSWGKNAIATATVTGGVITAVTITNNGGGFTGSTFTSWTKVGGAAISATTAPTLTGTVAVNDPLLSSRFNNLQYMISNLAMGALGGTPVQGGTMQVDYMKAWRRKLVTPIFPSGTQSETTAIVAQMTANGATPTGAQQTLINDFIRQAKGWQLRWDTVPMDGFTSDWDITKLSLWDAIEGLYFIGLGLEGQGKVNWKNPSSSTDLIKVGTIPFIANQGYSLPGTAGTYLRTQITPGTGWLKAYDSHLGVWLQSAPTNATLSPLMGCASQMAAFASTTTHDTLLNSPSPSGRFDKLPLSAGHFVFTAGWRMSRTVYQDGQPFTAYVTGSPALSTYGEMLIGTNATGTAGAAYIAKAAHWGRGLRQLEAEKLYSLMNAVLSAW